MKTLLALSLVIAALFTFSACETSYQPVGYTYTHTTPVVQSYATVQPEPVVYQEDATYPVYTGYGVANTYDYGYPYYGSTDVNVIYDNDNDNDNRYHRHYGHHEYNEGREGREFRKDYREDRREFRKDYREDRHEMHGGMTYGRHESQDHRTSQRQHRHQPQPIKH